MSNKNLKETPEAQTPAPAENGEVEAATPVVEENPFEQLQSDLGRFRDLAMRTQADFENYRKRAIREKEEAIKYANASLIERLIPVIDNFEFGIQAARAEGSQAVLVGLEMVSKQFQEFWLPWVSKQWMRKASHLILICTRPSVRKRARRWRKDRLSVNCAKVINCVTGLFVRRMFLYQKVRHDGDKTRLLRSAWGFEIRHGG